MPYRRESSFHWTGPTNYIGYTLNGSSNTIVTCRQAQIPLHEIIVSNTYSFPSTAEI